MNILDLSGRTIFSDKEKTTQKTVLNALDDGISLGYADLRSVSFRGLILNNIRLPHANLGGCDFTDAALVSAYLPHAHLVNAHLRGANLSYANFCHASLVWADCQGCSLIGANFDYAELTHTNLHNASMNWSSHDLIAELLFREADSEDVEKLKIAGLVFLQRDWCWNHFRDLKDPLQRWAFRVLKKYSTEASPFPTFERRRR